MGQVSALAAAVYLWLAQPVVSLAGPVPVAVEAAEPAGFVWEAPEQCPRRAAVVQRLADVLGVGSAARAEPLLMRGHTRGTIRREGERWVLELEVTDAAGSKRRRLEAERCTDLAHAAALALALLLEEAAARDGHSPAVRPNAARVPSQPEPRPAAWPVVGGGLAVRDGAALAVPRPARPEVPLPAKPRPVR